jgi:phage gpG-like protein
MRIQLRVDGAAPAKAVLERTASRLSQPVRPRLQVLAAELQTYLQGHLRAEAGPEGPWPALMPQTRAIRRHYGHGDGPRLIRAGDLLHSITTLGLTDRSVDVGTNMRYARTVNDGGDVADSKTGKTRTVQAFPFVYVTPGEVQDLMTLIKEYFLAPA